MNRNAVVAALRLHVVSQPVPEPGMRLLLEFVITWLKHLEMEELDTGDIDNLLPHLLVEACEKLRTSQALDVARRRQRFERETGGPLQELTRIDAKNPIARRLTIAYLVRHLERALGNEALAYAIRTLFYTEEEAVLLAFSRHVLPVYQAALQRVSEVKFGGVILTIHDQEGQVSFTLYTQLEPGEVVRILMPASGPLVRAYLEVQDCRVPLLEALVMIRTVGEPWADQLRPPTEELPPL